MARKKMTEAEALKAQAEALLHEQQQVLAHAGSVVRQASRELGRVTSEEVVPRVVRGTRTAASTTRDKIVDDVLPSIAAAIGSTLSVIDAARDKRAGEITKQVAKLAAGKKAVSKAAPASSASAGKYIAIGIGVAALLGVGYVVWQTFRADDELWVSEDE
jgi:sorbitol-specific phosphotransferase system component IIA